MTHPPGCGDLHCMVMRLRLELHAEAPTAMHTHAAPVLRDSDGLMDTRYPDEGGIGMPMTAAFHRFLGHPDHWGLSRLGMLSILEVSDWCSAAHPSHRRPLFTRSLCSQLTYEATYLHQDVADLAWLHPELELAQIVGMLTAALRHAEDWRGERFARWSKVPGEQPPLPERRQRA